MEAEAALEVRCETPVPLVPRTLVPRLDKGPHGYHNTGNCSTEVIALALYHAAPYLLTEVERKAIRCGAIFDDMDCISTIITWTVQAVNDLMPDQQSRDKLVPLLPRVARCQKHSEPDAQGRIETRLMGWALQSVSHLEAKDNGYAIEARNRAAEAASEEDPEFRQLSLHEALVSCVSAIRYENSAFKVLGDGSKTKTKLVLVEDTTYPDTLVEWLSDFLDAWEKIAADEGVLADLPDVEDVIAEWVDKEFGL